MHHPNITPATSPFSLGSDGHVMATIDVPGKPSLARLGQYSGNYAALWIANDSTGAVTDELVSECHTWLENQGMTVEVIPNG